MYTISGGGSFTRTNIDQINSNFSELSGAGANGASVDVYVNPQYGNNNNSGLSAGSPKATLAGCASLIAPGIRIGLLGVLTEEYVGPIVNDVTIIGLGNHPRQATTSGSPNGGGATWISPSGGAGILCTVKGQAWRFQNLYFNNSAAQPCVQLLRSGTGDVPADPDASHAEVIGCVFTGADAGIQASGGIAFVTIAGCTLFNFAGAGDTGVEVVTGAGIGTNWGWKIVGNQFYNNVNHLVGALVNATIANNSLIVHGNSVTSTIGLDLTGGAGNAVMGNFIDDNLSGAVAAWTGGTNDAWCNYYADDGVASGVPS